MTRKLFGTDGIRGRANSEPMTPETAVQLGRAITALSTQRQRRQCPEILVGKDTRLSGYMLETAFASGVCAMGGRVLLCGPLPTPAIANLTVSMRADAGVVISASHNPYEDNGIKFFGPDGFKLADELEHRIEEMLGSGKALEPSLAVGSKVGRAERVEDATGRYIVYAKATLPSNITLDGLRVVVDAGHGAAYKVAPAVFAELGADVNTLGCEPNGKNINDGVGALYPERVARAVREQGADLGIALDGDADRLVLVDERGEEVDGDAVLAMCGLRLLREERLPYQTLVATILSNMGLEHALQQANGKLVRTPVGDRHVVTEMRKNGYGFGGEQSGHLVFMDHSTTGDGIISALQVLGIMVSTDRPLSELARVMQPVPQLKKNLQLGKRKPLEEMFELNRCVRAHEHALGGEGRIVVRWSGTEPKLRLMVESPSEDQNAAVLSDLAAAARTDIGNSQGTMHA